MTGRIDVHSHLLPGIDDGCTSIEDSILCARMLVAAGYTHAFCTPHIWPNLTRNTVTNIPLWTADLQTRLVEEDVDLRLIPGGEINLRDNIWETKPEDVVTMAMAGTHILCDFWADKLPKWFERAIRWFQGLGLTVILAHPERVRAVQDDPTIVDHFADMDMVLQGNLQCLADADGTPYRRTVERLLLEGAYTMLGSDTHNSSTLAMRLDGLKRAIQLVGREAVDKLTIDAPRKLLPKGMLAGT